MRPLAPLLNSPDGLHSYRFIVRELGNLTTLVEDVNRPVEWELIEQVLLSSSEPYNCTDSHSPHVRHSFAAQALFASMRPWPQGYAHRSAYACRH